jgi:hypothetical protein
MENVYVKKKSKKKIEKKDFLKQKNKITFVVDTLVRFESVESIILGMGNNKLPERETPLTKKQPEIDDDSKKENKTTITKIEEEVSKDPPKEIIIQDFYKQSVEESFYSNGGIFDQSVDYMKIWGYDTNTSTQSGFYATDGFSQNPGFSYSSSDERIGALTEQHAHSILEKMIKMKQFGDDPSGITPDEKERYENWEHFNCNKALRNLWKQTSTVRYDEFLPLLMTDAREA